MSRAVAPALLLSCCALTGVSALEDDFGGFSDLRLNIHAYGVGYDVTFGGVTEEDNFDTTWRFGVTWIASLGLAPRRGGLMIGLGFNYGIMDADLGNGAGALMQTWTLQGYTGWGWSLSDRWQVEVLPTVGFGRAHLELDNSDLDLPTFKGSNKLIELGLMTNLVWTHPNGLQLGGTFGYLFSNTVIEEEITGIEFDWDTSNLTLGFIVGSRL